MGILLTEQSPAGVRTLTLNRPAARNALSDALLAELHTALDGADADDTARAVILAANGPAFCAGHDLREVQAKKGLNEYRDLFDRCSAMMLAITRLSKPVIAQVGGIATAAGCQLVASCDLAIASPAAKFSTPGVHIGLFCSTPMVALSRKVGRKTAMEMLLLGEPLSAACAARVGLINKVTEESELAETAQKWAEKCAEKSALTLAIGKKAFYQQAEMSLCDAYEFAGGVMADNMLKQDAQEGVSAFLEKRRPTWRNA